MKSIGYYPGCSLTGSASEYDASLKAIAQKLGIELQEIPEWLCCGASSAHALDHDAALCLATDTLVKARRAGLTEILTPCAMCYQRLATAAYELGKNPALKKQVLKAMGESPDLDVEKVRPLNLMDWLGSIPAAELAKCVTMPLGGLKVACYYGCLLVRPPQITGADDVETPRSMEQIVTALGAQPVRWSMAMECCGGSFSLSRKQAALRQSHRIYTSANAAGANLVVLACPMCHSNLDMRQAEYTIPGDRPVPVVYLTQLIGMAFGIDGKVLKLESHFVPVGPALAAVKAAVTDDPMVAAPRTMN